MLQPLCERYGLAFTKITAFAAWRLDISQTQDVWSHAKTALKVKGQGQMSPIAYSMGQIIKSVCVCQSVYLSVCASVRLRALSRSHFLSDFHQNWHRRKNPQKQERVRYGVNIAPPLPLFCPPKPPF